MKLNGISEFADISAVFVADAEFSVLHAEYDNAEGKRCFGLFHSVHIAVQRFFLRFGQMHGVHERLRFAVIRFFRLETVYGICGKCFVIVGRTKSDSFHLSAVIIQMFSRFTVAGYADGTAEEMRYAEYNAYLTDWQLAGVGLRKSDANRNKTITSVKVRLEYSANKGTAYFDGLSLREGKYVRQTAETKYEIQANGAWFALEDVKEVRYYEDGWKTAPAYKDGKLVLTGADVQAMMTQKPADGEASVYVGGELITSAAAVTGRYGMLASIYLVRDQSATGSGSGSGSFYYNLLAGSCYLHAKQVLEIEDGTNRRVRIRTNRDGKAVERTVIDANGTEFKTEYAYSAAGKLSSEENWERRRNGEHERDVYREHKPDPVPRVLL